MQDDEIEFAVKTCQTCGSKPTTAGEIHTLLKKRVAANCWNVLNIDTEVSDGRRRLVFWPLEKE